MSPNKTSILITGVTGYIGGSVLVRLLNHPDAASFKITTLLRSEEKAAKLKKLGVNAVVGSHVDEKLMESLSAESDVVIAIADADSMKAASATLAGLKKRHAATGVAPIFIHTSGTGVLTDFAVGDKAGDLIYDDNNPEQIESLPITQLHRDVDLFLANEDKKGYVKTFIVLPSMVYGIASGVLVDQGIQNPHSIQIPMLINAALGRGRAGMVGQGKNFWPNVHIDDVADLYIAVFNATRKGTPIGHGREGYYFGENGERTLYEIGKAIGEGLVALGKSDNAEPTTFTKEDLNKYAGGSDYMGTNCRCKGNRARAIGWTPKKTEAEFLSSIQPEIEALIKKAGKV